MGVGGGGVGWGGVGVGASFCSTADHRGSFWMQLGTTMDNLWVQSKCNWILKKPPGHEKMEFRFDHISKVVQIDANRSVYSPALLGVLLIFITLHH